MSVSFPGNVEAPVPVRLTTTSLTDIYTTQADDHSSTIAAWTLANETGSAVQVGCYFYNGTTDFLWFNRSVPANDTVLVIDVPMRLRGGNKFKVQAATGNAITVNPVVIRSHPNERL